MDGVAHTLDVIEELLLQELPSHLHHASTHQLRLSFDLFIVSTKENTREEEEERGYYPKLVHESNGAKVVVFFGV